MIFGKRRYYSTLTAILRVFYTLNFFRTHLLQLLSNTLLKGFPRRGLRGDTKPTKTSELLIFVFLLDTTRHKCNSIGACRLRQDSKTFFLTVTIQWQIDSWQIWFILSSNYLQFRKNFSKSICFSWISLLKFSFLLRIFYWRSHAHYCAACVFADTRMCTALGTNTHPRTSSPPPPGVQKLHQNLCHCAKSSSRHKHNNNITDIRARVLSLHPIIPPSH